ncbi:ribosome alternative rescue factor ArfA [Rhizobium laguerreae]|uniref:alternative ribosome rescue factor ArfA n=1 Tax=Rhizobium laguerreae TaxID=1076926 RepID=UPI001C91D86D|nr:ribosome alternative rescue factor ArfA [Rhizobium laguerreae]
MGKKNPVAFVLRTPLFRPRKTKVVKGKGAYTRKTRHRSGRTDGVFFVSGIRCPRSDFLTMSSFLTRPYLMPAK